ncbi:MAG: 23S rRNA (adenine(2030)-N(6))-methyltransferase RlmJ [Alphaproteobacteria bacterium]|nr:23S rRNA (adenine(2030)-N(6))-methyltransferase RlmJ [Alphaproteobacteria bacterium]
MNYRHAFHAGNFADVVKHVALALCLDRLNVKAAPYRFIDTHAGSGLYDLGGEEAQRSPEWRDAVARLWMSGPDVPAAVVEALSAYMRVLHDINPEGALRLYPGSPVIAARLMREQDAIRLCELHPESAAKLRETMAGDERVKIEVRDGFAALAAYLPPPERRGLVLIDPPFEEGVSDRKLDFEWMHRALRKAVKRWPGGTYLLWRPLKDIAAVGAFDDAMATMLIEELGLKPESLLVADLWVRPAGPGPLSGAGILIVNPPFGLRERLASALPWLSSVLDQTPDDAGASTAGWRLTSPEAEDPDDLMEEEPW